MLLMLMTPEALRQGSGFEEGLLLSGAPDLRLLHYIEPEPEPEPEHGSQDHSTQISRNEHGS